MELDRFLVNAFVGPEFLGNPAAVCPLEDWLDTDTMQAIAAANAVSETAFIVRGDDGSYAIRWFAPKGEIELCGHATLATSFVLRTQRGEKSDRIRFTFQGGEFHVFEKDGLLCLDFPSQPGSRVDRRDAIERAIGLKPSEVLFNGRYYLVVIGSEEQVRALDPDLELIKGLEPVDGNKPEGIIVSAPGDDCDVALRCFFPIKGNDEDPVTGSAQCIAAPYWAERAGGNELLCFQVSKRGGVLHVELKGDRVEIAGECVLETKDTIPVP